MLLRLSRRQGTAGVDVKLVREEVIALEKLECLHPERIFSKGTNVGFQTATKRMYCAASVLKVELSLSKPSTVNLS